MRRFFLGIFCFLMGAGAAQAQFSRTVMADENWFLIQRDAIIDTNNIAVRAGDLTGDTNTTTVVGLQGVPVVAPTGGDVGFRLAYDGTNMVWEAPTSGVMVSWGTIIGDITNQTDLWTELTNRYTKSEADSVFVEDTVTGAAGTVDAANKRLRESATRVVLDWGTRRLESPGGALSMWEVDEIATNGPQIVSFDALTNAMAKIEVDPKFTNMFDYIEYTNSGSLVTRNPGNSIIGGTSGFIGGGEGNIVTGPGDRNAILAGENNRVDGGSGSADSAVVAGASHVITNSNNGFIGGGFSSLMREAQESAIIAGSDHVMGDGSGSGVDRSVIGAGGGHFIADSVEDSFVGAGVDNSIFDTVKMSFIGAGQDNTIEDTEWGFIGAGRQNHLDDDAYGFIGAGQNNAISNFTDWSAIVGGQNNLIWDHADWNFIGAGDNNLIRDALRAFIGSGLGNQITNAPDSFIGSGEDNFIYNSRYGAIGSGQENVIDGGELNGILSGQENIIRTNSTLSFIGAGGANSIQATDRAFIGAGENNYIENSADAAILGAFNSAIDANNSIVLGRNATATNADSFVWSDGSTYGSHGDETFNVRADGGIYLDGANTFVEDASAGKEAVNWRTMTNFVLGTTLVGVTISNGTFIGGTITNTDAFLDSLTMNGDIVGSGTNALYGFIEFVVNVTNDIQLTLEDAGKAFIANGTGDITISLPTNITADTRGMDFTFVNLTTNLLILDAFDTDFIDDSDLGAQIYSGEGQSNLWPWSSITLKQADTNWWHALYARGDWTTTGTNASPIPAGQLTVSFNTMSNYIEGLGHLTTNDSPVMVTGSTWSFALASVTNIADSGNEVVNWITLTNQIAATTNTAGLQTVLNIGNDSTTAVSFASFSAPSGAYFINVPTNEAHLPRLGRTQANLLWSGKSIQIGDSLGDGNGTGILINDGSRFISGAASNISFEASGTGGSIGLTGSSGAFVAIDSPFLTVQAAMQVRDNAGDVLQFQFGSATNVPVLIDDRGIWLSEGIATTGEQIVNWQSLTNAIATLGLLTTNDSPTMAAGTVWTFEQAQIRQEVFETISTNFQLTLADAGKVFFVSGVVEVVVSLPTNITAATRGHDYRFVNLTTNILTIDAAASDFIDDSDLDGQIYSGVGGTNYWPWSSITLKQADSNWWHVLAARGDWTTTGTNTTDVPPPVKAIGGTTITTADITNNVVSYGATFTTPMYPTLTLGTGATFVATLEVVDFTMTNFTYRVRGAGGFVTNGGWQVIWNSAPPL